MKKTPLNYRYEERKEEIPGGSTYVELVHRTEKDVRSEENLRIWHTVVSVLWKGGRGQD